MQIIFDFDGVIINSHKIKSAAFFKIFKIYGENVGLSALNYHIKNIGKSRYQKFRFIYEKFLRKKFTKKELIKIDKAFEEFTVNKILKMKPNPNLINFLKKNKNKHKFYVSTGTPQKKIKILMKKKNLYNLFRKIYGSPKSKIDHIKKIVKKNKKTIFIGDSLEDYKCAKKMNIFFLLKINSENISFRNKLKIKKIHSFKYLNKYLELR